MDLHSLWKKLVWGCSPEKQEESKTVLILRINSVIMCIYFLALLFSFLGVSNLFIPACTVPCFVAYLFLFYLTYLNRTRMALFFHHFLSLVFVTLFVYMYGWDSGVQHFIFVCVVMTYAAGGGTIKQKNLYVFLLCIMRLGLYFYTNIRKPVVTVPDGLGVYFQVVNTTVIFASIAACLMIFTMEAMDMKRRLSSLAGREKLFEETDRTTGILNRQYIVDYLRRAAEPVEGVKHKRIILAVGNVDGFCHINEKFGYSCGDVVLYQIAHQIRQFMGDQGPAGRLYSDHFLLLFEDMSLQEAQDRVRELGGLLAAADFCWQKETLRITMSFGIAEIDREKGLDASLAEAERRLRTVKQAGDGIMIMSAEKI